MTTYSLHRSRICKSLFEIDKKEKQVFNLILMYRGHEIIKTRDPDMMDSELTSSVAYPILFGLFDCSDTKPYQ